MKEKGFNKLGLSPEVYSAIKKMGYKTPTEIQTKTIPLILAGKDVIGQSQTGTGKTMAFGLPAVDMVNPKEKAVQVLILCPTRELALQAAGEIEKAAEFKHDVKAVAVFGGAPIESQIKAIKRGAQIIIGTPGRVMDHMRRRTLKLGALKLAVLDEADEMLNMGFRHDMETILGDAPKNRITVLFSATMSKEIMQLTRNFQHNAEFIKSGEKNLTVSAIDQSHCFVDKNKKTDAVVRHLLVYQPKMALVFCNTKRMVDTLVDRLKTQQLSAAALHGDMDQHARNRVMKAYRDGRVGVLIATDVAARGLDVDGVELVINYDIPKDMEYYVHRIGRTGRAGRSGRAVTLVAGNAQKSDIKKLEKYIKTNIPFRKLPSHAEVERKQSKTLMETIKKEVENNSNEKSLAIIKRLEDEGLSSRDIAAALLNMMQSGGMSSKSDAPKRAYGNTGAQAGMVRFFINLGKKDQIAARDIVGCIAGEANISGSEIGKIDIFDKYSFVEVPENHAPTVQSTMCGVMMKGRYMNFEPAVGRN